MTPREIAQGYLDAGWVPVPLPSRSKKAGRGWADRRLESARPTLEREFGAKPQGQNVAILLGEPSGGLVDVDLDCPEALDLARELLPATRTFGRVSNPASHWLFVAPKVKSISYQEPPTYGVTPQTLVELRADRRLTVFPGSVHECGEAIAWTDGSTPIAKIEAADLYKCVARLAVACLLHRQGMSREEAIETANTNGEFLLDHPCTATVRKWLTGKTDRTKSGKKAASGSAGKIDAAVEAFNRANPGSWPKSGGACPACQHDGCFGTMPDNPSRWACFSGSHTAPGLAGNNCHHGDALDLVAFETHRTRIEVLIASGHLQPEHVPAEAREIEFITDLGTANRFIKKHGQNVRHVRALKTWFIWDGRSWRPDDTGKALNSCAEVAREVTVETASNDEKVHKAARQQEQKSRIAGALDLAGVNPAVAIRVADLDANPWLLACENGTLDLQTGLLRRHERGDLITKVLPHKFDSTAACPRWDRFLNEVMNERTALVDFLHRWSGYCLTASTREHAVLLAVGKGCNGKSVFVETLMFVLGSEFATPAAPGLLLAQKGERHPTEIMDLLARRLVVTNEVPKNTTFNEERVKSLSGGDSLKGRGMRMDFVEFKPTHKLVLCANHMPRVKDPSAGFWRRLRVVPFDVSFEGRQDRTLTETLRAEAPGILARMVRECLLWQAQGLGDPVEVKEATKAYREAEDLLGQFLMDRAVTGAGTTEVPGSALYAEYKAWCEANGERPAPNKSFTEELESLGWVRRRKNTGNVWSTAPTQSGGVEAGGATDPLNPSSARAREELQPKDASTCFHGSTGKAEENGESATELRQRFGLGFEEFADLCRGCIGRVAPSTAQEDAAVAHEILQRYRHGGAA